MKSILWRLAKRLSYIEDARCLKVKEVLGENQFGFRRGKRNRDATGMLKMISERTMDVDEELCACFIDG